MFTRAVFAVLNCYAASKKVVAEKQPVFDTESVSILIFFAIVNIQARRPSSRADHADYFEVRLFHADEHSFRESSAMFKITMDRFQTSHRMKSLVDHSELARRQIVGGLEIGPSTAPLSASVVQLPTGDALSVCSTQELVLLFF